MRFYAEHFELFASLSLRGPQRGRQATDSNYNARTAYRIAGSPKLNAEFSLSMT